MDESLLFAQGQKCGWCLSGEATTSLYSTPTCLACATVDPQSRVKRWLGAVGRRMERQRMEQP